MQLFEQTKLLFLDHDELAAQLRSGLDHLVVVDVRDDDFAGGNIAGARNECSEDLEDGDAMDELVEALHGEGAERVVFHCMMSQQRGPTTAQRFLNRLAILEPDEDAEGGGGGAAAPVIVPEVCVLTGGFQQWVEKFRAEADLCENLDPALWPPPAAAFDTSGGF